MGDGIESDYIYRYDKPFVVPKNLQKYRLNKTKQKHDSMKKSLFLLTIKNNNYLTNTCKISV